MVQNYFELGIAITMTARKRKRLLLLLYHLYCFCFLSIKHLSHNIIAFASIAFFT